MGGQVIRATGRVHNNTHIQSELFPLYWEGYGEKVQLGSGDTRHLLIARQESWPTDLELPHTLHGLDIYKATASTAQGFGVFRSGIWGIFKDGSPNKADPVYLEVLIKPISSSKKEYKAYYVLEQPLLTKLVFRKVESFPPISAIKGSNHRLISVIGHDIIIYIPQFTIFGFQLVGVKWFHFMGNVLRSMFRREF